MSLCKVNYLRILLTSRCNMFCAFCHREGAVCDSCDIDRTLLLEVISTMYNLGFKKFKLMGGEPMLYPNMALIVREIRKRIGDSDLSMISNGTAASGEYEKLLSAGMNRLNISVHGWMPEFFVANTRCSLKTYGRIKNTILELAEKRLIGKLNYVVKKGRNEEDFFKLLVFAGENELVVDALNLLNMDGDTRLINLYYSMSSIERLIRSKYKIRDVTMVNNKYSLPSKLLKLENGAMVNLKISRLNEENVFKACLDCGLKKSCIEGIKAIRLTPSGVLQPCLMRRDNGLALIKKHDKSSITKYLEYL